MKRMTYAKLLSIAVFASVAMIIIVSSGKAAAATFCGCGMLSQVNNSNSDANCEDENDANCNARYPGHTVANNFGSMTLEGSGNEATIKSNFIRNLQWFAGQHPYQQISAQWIESRLGGSDWAARINSPNVVLKLESHAYGQNTMYMPANNNGKPSTTNGSVQAYSENGSALSIVIYVNGVFYDAVKVDCGNMIGSWRALPPPNQPPSGSFISLVCNAGAETYTISVQFRDPDAATTAELRGSGGAVYATSGGTSATWTISTKTLQPGSFPVGLWVRDTGPSGPNTYKEVATHAIANCNPQGNIAATSCDQVTASMWDPNQPASGMTIYVSVNGGARWTPSPSTVNGQGTSTSFSILNAPGFDPWKKNNSVALYGRDFQNPGAYVNVANTTTNAICDSIACDPPGNSLPGDLVAGEKYPFKVWMKINGPKIVAPPGASFSSIKIEALNTSSAYANPPVGNDLYSNSVNFTPQTAGNYTLSWTLSGGEAFPASTTCTQNNIRIAYEPYFDVLGGDTSAGEGFGGSCTPQNADIAGNNNPGNNYFGASSSQGALATGKISQFASDTTNNLATNMGGSTDGLATHQPSGLAFANKPPLAASTYGGSFLGSPFPATPQKWCVPDYVTNDTEAATAPGLPASFGTLPANSNNVYRVSGNQTIGGFVLPKGVHVTVIVTNGDVFIDGNITYAGYTKLTEIPQFTLLVQNGDIYVRASPSAINNVSELHGFYDAQPNIAGNHGVIYTCSTASGNESTNYSICSNSVLNFYGAVSAKMIVPGRMIGNVAPSAVSTNPAEVFDFTPELWLGSISNTTTSCAIDPSQVGCLYQSYTSLPPVL